MENLREIDQGQIKLIGVGVNARKEKWQKKMLKCRLRTRKQ